MEFGRSRRPHSISHCSTRHSSLLRGLLIREMISMGWFLSNSIEELPWTWGTFRGRADRVMCTSLYRPRDLPDINTTNQLRRNDIVSPPDITKERRRIREDRSKGDLKKFRPRFAGDCVMRISLCGFADNQCFRLFGVAQIRLTPLCPRRKRCRTLIRNVDNTARAAIAAAIAREER